MYNIKEDDVKERIGNMAVNIVYYCDYKGQTLKKIIDNIRLSDISVTLMMLLSTGINHIEITSNSVGISNITNELVKSGRYEYIDEYLDKLNRKHYNYYMTESNKAITLTSEQGKVSVDAARFS